MMMETVLAHDGAAATQEQVPTCKWYVSIDQPECGAEAPNKVTIKTQIAQVTVDLCDAHKHVHNENFARRRTQGKSRTPRNQ